MSGYESFVDNQTIVLSMNRIHGRWYANFCVKDVVVFDEAVDGAVILAFLEGTGSNVKGVTTTGTPTSFSTIATTSTDATNATTSSAAMSSTLIATVIASTSAAGSIEPWVVGVIVGGALLVLLLVGVAVFCVIKRRRAQRKLSESDNPIAVAAEMKQASQYASIPPNNEYDQGRLAPSDYNVVPVPGNSNSNDYASGRIVN